MPARPPRKPLPSSSRPLARAILVGSLLLLPALPAVAKSFSMQNADVTAVVLPDGSIEVTEILGFRFSGDFSGAYRDIPLRSGEELTVISVGDENGTYQLGGCTTLGCSSPPGLYGVETHSTFVRVVWHHSSSNEIRHFKLIYRIAGLAVAYDDVVDINLQVWGDQWAVGLDRLTARILLPAGVAPGEVLVWGHPFSVDGETELGSDGVSPALTARNVPPEQWVELRTVFPTHLLTDTSRAKTVSGDGLDRILAEEAQFATDAEEAEAAARRGLVIGLGLAATIVFGLGGFVYLRYGKEPKVDYDQDYEHAPPSELSPAEVGALLSQGGVDEKEFTATLFDLIRRGAISATPSEVTRSTWGGLRTESITDLVLDLAETDIELNRHEESVLTIVARVLELGPRPLHEFRSGIREDAQANASTYQAFRQRVVDALKGSGLIERAGYGVSWMIRLGLIAAIVVAFFALQRFVVGQPGGRTFPVLVVGGMVLGSAVLWVLLSFRRFRTKRTPGGGLAAARWSRGLLRSRRGTCDLARPVGPLPRIRHCLRRGRGGAGAGPPPRSSRAGRAVLDLLVWEPWLHRRAHRERLRRDSVRSQWSLHPTFPGWRGRVLRRRRGRRWRRGRWRLVMRRLSLASAVLMLASLSALAADGNRPMPEYSGPEFQALYEYAVANTLPNLGATNSQHEITGNEELDTRIWEIAFGRGYVLRPSATGDLVQADGVWMQPQAAEAWLALKQEARAAGMKFVVSSAYRSPETQRQWFLTRLSGTSESAINDTLDWYSVPGTSKHHAGYALDFRYVDGTFGGFRATPDYAWLAADNFAVPKRYGFVPSYPDDGESQGPRPEPWEFVWVGVDLIECGIPQEVSISIDGPASALVREIGRCPGGPAPVELPGWLEG